MAALLPDELVEEIFLRVPPDEPAFLVRAALVCKAWRRILLSDDGDGGGGGFLRRYRRFHRTPPLLGYIHNHNVGLGVGPPRFVPTSRFSPPAAAPPAHSVWATDCRHGRVLIHSRDDDELAAEALIVWDPVTGRQQRLSMPAYTYPPYRCSWSAAVLCAVDGCDHIDCHGGRRPFLVVFVEVRAAAGAAHQTTCTYWASVYSSLTGAWSAPAAPHISDKHYNIDRIRRPSLVIGDALYFPLWFDVTILRYDLSRHRLSIVDDMPPRAHVFEPVLVPIETADGELGFVAFSYHPRSCIYMWSRRRADGGGGANGGTGGAEVAWERIRIVELDALLPDPLQQRRSMFLNEYPFDAIRFAEGTNTIFISIYIRDNKGVFALDLKSRQLSKIGQSWVYPILPYMSFYTRHALYPTRSS